MESTNKPVKSRKPLVTRLLKWSGISFFVFLILLIAVPIIFQKKIFQMVLDEANKNLLAEVSIADYDMTLISSFPNLILKLKDVKISGRDEFADVDLIEASSIEAKLNLRSLFSEQIKIERIKLNDANIDVQINKDGKANYDITIPDSLAKEDTEPSKFALNLKSYELNNINLNYSDATDGTRVIITQMKHEGKGDLTESIVDFETNTQIEALTLISGGIPLLLGTRTEAVFNLLLETEDDKTRITLKENELKLNNFVTSYNGSIEMTDAFMDFDLKLDASRTTFASFLSLLPSVYKTGYESMVTKGSFELNGYLKGRMTETEMPGFLFKLLVNDASFSYPGFKSGFKNIAIDITAKREAGSNLDNTIVDVKKFNLAFLENKINANFFLSSIMSDPKIKANILAKLDLGTLEQVMPLMPGESYKGKLDADIQLDGRLSALEQERYEDFQAGGYMKLSNFILNSPDFSKPIHIQTAELEFSPKFLALRNANMAIGKSDLKMDGRVNNYMAYLFRDELLQGSFNLSSSYIDLDELMGLIPSSETTDAPSTTDSEESFAVPSNLDVNLNTNIAKLKYDNMIFSNLRGVVGIKESVASLSNIQMTAFGGTMSLNGKYDTQNIKEPKVNFDYAMRDVDIKQLNEQFMTVQKLMPVVKHIDGRLNTNFSLKSNLTSNLDLVLESLTGLGNFSVKTLQIGGYEPLNRLSSELRMPQLSSQTLKDVAASFSISDGKINLKPFNLKMDKIQVNNIQGWTSLTQNISYTMTMLVPKEMIPGEIVRNIEQAMSQLGGVAQKLNLSGLPAMIPVKVNVGGTITKPEVKTDFRESIQRLSGNLKDQVKDLINDKINQVRDTVTQVITNKIEEVKSDLLERKQRLIDDAQRQADQIKSAAKIQADNLRAQANKRADELVSAARNPIEKAAAERTARGIREEGERNARKIEEEANKRADQIMREAREQADRLK
jgi:uncharacterized protein involved in outer membrane biogenesis